jgi:5,10-methylenetetrahydromethanopterin reductase
LNHAKCVNSFDACKKPFFKAHALKRMILEAEITPALSPRQFLEISRLVEKLGFDRLGVSDVLGYPDSFVLQALSLKVTRNIKIGSLVSNPFTRHPALLASSFATLAELSGDRCYLGLGVGASLEKIGIRAQKPVRALKEAVQTIRALISGKEVNTKGVFSFERFKLLRPIGTPEIIIGTRSHKIAKLAGEIADGVVLGARFTSKEYLSELLKCVKMGARKAKRKPSELFVAPRLTLCCSKDGELARKSVKPYVAHYYSVVGRLNPEYEQSVAQKLERLLKKVDDWYFSPSAIWPREMYELMDEEMVDKFAIAGTPEQCAQRVLQILEKTEFNGVSFNIAPVRRGDYFLGLKETLLSIGVKTLILWRTVLG